MNFVYRWLFFCAFLCFTAFSVSAQDTLPNFTVRAIGQNKVQISWVNTYESCVQLAVQRSYDSLHYFNTIYSAQSPALPQNGFIDNKAPSTIKVFYRIFYVFKGGKYFFTKSKVPNSKETFTQIEPPSNTNLAITKPTEDKAIITIYNKSLDKILAQLDYNAYRKFVDSIATKTKDTFRVISPTEAVLKPYVAKPVWTVSTNIFTNKTGTVNIHLPLIKLHKYSIVFYEENGDEFFAIKHIKESDLVLEKSNFMHAGWFYFELYEDEILKERNRFYLEKIF